MIQTAHSLIISYKPILYNNILNREPHSHVQQRVFILPLGVNVIHYKQLQNANMAHRKCGRVHPDVFWELDQPTSW